jgi:hypothetical protein
VLQVLSTVASGAVGAGAAGPGLLALGVVLALALNLLLFFAVVRLLTDESVPRKELRVGIVIAAVAWEQTAGGLYVHHVFQRAKETYGTSRPSSACSCGFTSARGCWSTQRRSTSCPRVVCTRAGCSPR